MLEFIFPESQIMAARKQFRSGVPVNDLSRQVGVSPAIFYKWNAKYGGLDASELSRLRELDEEHRGRARGAFGSADGVGMAGLVLGGGSV